MPGGFGRAGGVIPPSIPMSLSTHLFCKVLVLCYGVVLVSMRDGS